MPNSNDGSHIAGAHLHAFARGELADGSEIEAERHIGGCLACRVRLRRLNDASLPPASPAMLDALVGASPSIPSHLREAVAKDPTDAPQEGELWRVGNDQAMLVWTRRILEDSALVVPVAFEPELADEFSLIIPENASPLGIDLVLLTSVEAHIDLRAYIQPFASLDVGDQIVRLRDARRHRAADPDLYVGNPIETQADQRIEYQQLVADLLADLSPEAYAISDSYEPEDVDVDLYGEHLRELSWRRPAALIEISPAERVGVDAAHELLALGRVIDLDATVLLAALVGPISDRHLMSRETAEACGSLIRAHHESNAVAVSICDANWTTVVIDAESTAIAIEPPSGFYSGARVPREPLPLVDALFKHLEIQLTNSDDEESVDEMNEPLVTLASTIDALAQAAIEKTVASGKRSSAPKKEVFTAFGSAEAEKVADLTRRVIAGERAEDAIEDLLEGLTE